MLNMKYTIVNVAFLVVLGLALSTSCKSDDKEIADKGFVSFSEGKDYFPIVQNSMGVPIFVDAEAYPGVKKIVKLFQTDIEKVAGVTCEINTGSTPQGTVIIIGTLGKSSLIDELVKNNKINVEDVKGRWETSLIQVVDNPMPNVDKALVIAGSDKRGTIYGMFDISRKIGVSPWYWWADVPVKKQDELFIKPGRYNLGEPKVRYRGIFLNDEEPALGRWAVENYGGFTHEFYEKVFELLLRQKANFLWPAMWWASFNSNDPLNPKLADEMGIVMSTSHHEPMMRAHAEWRPYGGGEWNYATNKEQLDQFWREGIERMGDFESVVTLGMRGDGDKAMSEGTNIQLLENVVAEQRKIIENVTQKKAEETPQVWALYKEVQAYYDKGMEVPDDVTLLFCDDNWGNVRDLPDPDAPERAGGYGMYYHFDYVGAPRSYKWLNTNSLPRVWEQLRLTYEYGVDRIWLVNVGDLKPMELPISFFCDYAWNPEAMPVDKMEAYTTQWAIEQFGKKDAKEIAELLDLYSKYSRRRTPELLNAETFSLTNYREFERIVTDYNSLADRAEKLYNEADANEADAFYQLVYFPIEISANLYSMYWYLAKNKQYAKENRASTNEMAQKVRDLFIRDSLLTVEFHTDLADGKWNHMMAQPHIGYTSWNDPKHNIMPNVKYIEIPRDGKLLAKVEGLDLVLSPDDNMKSTLNFDNINDQELYFEVFNTGQNTIDYEITAPEWIKSATGNRVLQYEERFFVSVNWDELESSELGIIKIKAEKGDEIEIKVIANKYDAGDLGLKGFVENNGIVSIEAINFDTAYTADGIDWEVIEGLGNTAGSVTTVPVSKGYKAFSNENPSLEYTFSLMNQPEEGSIILYAYFGPTQDFRDKGGLRYAMSIDGGEPIVYNLHEGFKGEDWNYARWWTNAVANNKFVKTSKHKLIGAGTHTIKYSMIDPGLVLQKLIIDNGGLKPSYLGPVQSKLYE